MQECHRAPHRQLPLAKLYWTTTNKGFSAGWTLLSTTPWQCVFRVRQQGSMWAWSPHCYWYDTRSKPFPIISDHKKTQVRWKAIKRLQEKWGRTEQSLYSIYKPHRIRFLCCLQGKVRGTQRGCGSGTRLHNKQGTDKTAVCNSHPTPNKQTEAEL